MKYKILADWAKQHKDISYEQLMPVLDNLNQSEYIDEVTSMGYLLQRFNKYRLNLDLSKLDQWVSHLQGWAEIDSLCQSTFDKKDLESRWKEWKSLLIKWNKSNNISKQRASLVTLIKTLRQTDNQDIIRTAFINIENLKLETDKLITKAISWILREMVRANGSKRESVENFINKNQDILPKFVIREVKNKLTTGKK